jgi:predicted GNAT superfamily acetyltransferase
VELQRSVWGFGDPDVVPAHVLLTAAHNGGLVLGAFRGARMVGMVFGFVGLQRDGRPKHVSHMAGVLEEAQGQGVGSALKWAQREYVLEQGIDLATWTFDPCEARNAAFNLRHLGGIARTYHVNLYGDLGDELNRGLPSDRLQVEWWLSSARVTDRLRSVRHHPPDHARTDIPGECETMTESVRRNDGTRAPRAWTRASATSCRIEIPASMQTLKALQPELAREWRQFVREALSDALAAGYVATTVDTERSADEVPRPFYVLERQHAVR